MYSQDETPLDASVTTAAGRGCYLSEPVDGVKEQSADKLPLSLRQALHFLHDVHVREDQGAPCDSTIAAELIHGDVLRFSVCRSLTQQITDPI